MASSLRPYYPGLPEQPRNPESMSFESPMPFHNETDCIHLTAQSSMETIAQTLKSMNLIPSRSLKQYEMLILPNGIGEYAVETRPLKRALSISKEVMEM